MGTRSLTVFIEPSYKDDEHEIAVMYRQFDGYISEHGHELAQFLAGRLVVNGIGPDDMRNFNGMGCLAAQVVAHFKTEVGGFYLHAAGTRDVGEEFIYEIRNINSVLEITVFSGYGDEMTQIFKGMPSELATFIEPVEV